MIVVGLISFLLLLIVMVVAITSSMMLLAWMYQLVTTHMRNVSRFPERSPTYLWLRYALAVPKVM